jgi:hypothetical protein
MEVKVMNDVVHILNTKQAGLYVKHGVKPIDLYWSDGVLVFVFTKAETNKLFTKWLNRTLH